MTADDMTAAEICQHLGISRRTFARYCAGGLKPIAVRAKDGAKLYRMGDVERYMRHIERRGPRPNPKPTREAQPVPVAAVQAAPPIPQPRNTQDLERVLSGAHPDELMDMQKRIATAERACYGKWARAMQEFQNGIGDWTPSEIGKLHRSWRESQEMVRRLAKELPEILYRKARYVDAVALGETLARAGAIVASELDQLGQAIAERCVGRDVREIRTVIDEAVANARGALVAELEKLTGTKP